jgi:hypothetical protein
MVFPFIFLYNPNSIYIYFNYAQLVAFNAIIETIRDATDAKALATPNIVIIGESDHKR